MHSIFSSTWQVLNAFHLLSSTWQVEPYRCILSFHRHGR
jgi:hypothetical protein